MRVTVVLTAGLLGLVAVSADAAAERGAPAAARPTFAGSWALNKERSDDAGAKMKEARGEHPRGPRGGGPMGGGPTGVGPMAGGPVGGPMRGPGMGSGMGAPPDPEEMERMQTAMDDALRPSEALLVSQEGVAFEVVHDGERVERLYADGRKNKSSAGIERKTKWDAGTLVTEAKLGGFGASMKITQTWAILEAEHLTITTRLEGGPFENGLVLKRVYGRVPVP